METGLVLERLKASQIEMRKRRRTMAAPTQTPRTTHRRRPKMEVGLESWSFIAAAAVVVVVE